MVLVLVDQGMQPHDASQVCTEEKDYTALCLAFLTRSTVKRPIDNELYLRHLFSDDIFPETKGIERVSKLKWLLIFFSTKKQNCTGVLNRLETLFNENELKLGIAE